MDPRYPIGDFAMPAQVSPARRQQAIEEIAATPSKMRAAVRSERLATGHSLPRRRLDRAPGRASCSG